MLANYQCGQNDIPSVPSGDIIQPNVGDEIAINSIAFEVVELDGSGNGRGIVKVPMFNNAKFGVEFKGIKVAKGGCVVAGQAELSNVDVALLNEEQRKKLAETYEAFTKTLDFVDANAEGVAETFNSVWALMDGIKDRAAKLAAKLRGGQNPTAKEIKDLAKLTENSAAMLQKSLNDIKKQAQADAGKVDEMQKIIDQQKASAKALLSSAKDIKMGKDNLPTPQDPMAKASTQNQVDALAMTNGADVKKKLDGLKGSNLMIEYNKVAYTNGKTITISNKEAVSGFTLKNVIEGEDLAWVVKDGDKVLNNFTANPVGLMWPDGTTKLTLEATQGNRKMSLTLQRKTFTFTGLIAIDANTPNRRTKLADETLYLVRSPNDSRTIKYEMTTNAKKNDFVGIEPNWTTTLPLNNLYEGKVLTGINNTTGETRHTSESKGSVSAEAFEKTYGVKVEVVDKYDNQADYTQTLKGIGEVFGIVSYISKKVGTIVPCEVYLPNLNELITNKTFNVGYNVLNDEEKDRHYTDKKVFSFKLLSPKIAGFSCEKNLGIKFWIIDLSVGSLFFDLNLGSNINMSHETKIIFETKKESSRMYLQGGLELGLDVGAKLGNEWEVNGMKVGLIATTSVNGSGGGKVEFPYESNKNEVGIYFYINPVKVKIKGEASAGIYSKEIAWDYILLDTKKDSGKFVVNIQNGSSRWD